jgi:dTDP-4-dehydrorhamnose reductase
MVFNFPKTLITGGESMMAQYLVRELTGNALAPSRHELDISDVEAFKEILSEEKIKVVINTAGVTKGDRETLIDVNGRYPGALARICREQDICFVFLSTARVFDGNCSLPYVESDTPYPIDNYGLSKYTGEQLVTRGSGPGEYYIFRLPMILGVRRKHPEGQILTRLINQARNTGHIQAAEDVYHSPVFAGDVAVFISRAIKERISPGLYHLTNGEGVSLYDLTREVFKNLGETATITPVPAAIFDHSAASPRYQVLGGVKMKLLAGWKEAAKRFADELRSV